MTPLDPFDPIAQVELAILARLNAASVQEAVPYKWATLDTYPENWDEYLKDKTPRAPGAWVVFGGFGPPDNDAGRLRLPASFGVCVMVRNSRPGETSQRHGGPDPANEVGSYRLVLDAVRLLARQDLGLDIDGFDIGSINKVRTDRIVALDDCSMYAIELRTTLPIEPLDLDDADLGDFETFHANWDIPAFATPVAIDVAPGTPGVQIPDDAHADATDHVTLETQP